MGLDTTHNCWHGSCTSFNTFRRKLAQMVGVDLYSHIGYGGDLSEEHLMQASNELFPLLNHSDCDGLLSPQECSLVAKGLTKILLEIDKNPDPDLYFKDKVKMFRDGCLLAVEREENVEFG